MLFNGSELRARAVEEVVIPRQSGPLVFKFQSILDLEEFDKRVPIPEPPMVKRKGGDQLEPKLDDENYQQALKDRGDKRFNWLFLDTIKATEWLTWETVDLDDPETWGNYEQELKNAGFSYIERDVLLGIAMRVNSLEPEYIERATKDFLAGRLDQEKGEG